MKETTHARPLTPVVAVLMVLVAFFAGLVNVDQARAYDLSYEMNLAGGYIDLSSRIEPIPVHMGTDYLAVSQNAGAIKGLKISNKSVASLEKLGSKEIVIVPKKCGTATISYKQKGKTKKFKVKVIKYQSPVKTLKVGKKNYAKWFKDCSCAGYVFDEAAGVIKVEAAPGWHLDKIVVNGKAVKNGYKVKRYKDYIDVIVFKRNGSSQIRVLTPMSAWD